MKTKIFVLLVFAALSLPAFSQSPAEVKMYEKTIAKPSVKAYERFLKRFPESVYFAEIANLYDSTAYLTVDTTNLAALLKYKSQCKTLAWKEVAYKAIDVVETSPLSAEEIATAAQNLGLTDYASIAYRNAGKDYLVAYNLGEELSVKVYAYNDGLWEENGSYQIAKECVQGGMKAKLLQEAQVVRVQDLRLVKFSYLSVDDLYAEYAQQLVNPLTGESDAVVFYGYNALTHRDKQAYKIEGQSPQALSNLIVTPQMQYLVNELNNDPCLSLISEADALTDDSIQWWLQNNPSATDGKKRTLRFGALDARCGLVAAFIKSNKESSARYRAALFDIRGYTVICIQDRQDGKYALAWCEKQCKNKKKDRLLNTIYFENETTLALFYYHGRKTFKRHLSLATKKIS